MHDFFFGSIGVLAWSCMAAIFVFCATWTWMLVLQIGGIRGTALATMFSGAAITTAGFALLLSHNTLIPGEIVGAVITAVWWPNVLAAIVLCDIYAADRNGHRSFTTRGYLWFKRLVDRNSHNDKWTP